MEVVFGAFCVWLSAVLGPTEVALSVKSHLQAWRTGCVGVRALTFRRAGASGVGGGC